MTLLKAARLFLTEELGAVGSIFMICTLPMFLVLSGLAIDGSAAFRTQAMLQVTADAAAQAAAMDLPNTSKATATAVSYSQKNMPVASDGTVLATSDVSSGNWNSTSRAYTVNGTPLNAVRVLVRRAASNANSLPSSFLGLIGKSNWDVAAQSIVTSSSSKLRVSLVLDNSGSMCQPDQQNPCVGDTNPNIKINALKTATRNLLNTLKGAASNAMDVTVAIVPFTTGVNVGTSNKSASWLTFAPWDTAGSGYGQYVGQQTCTGSGFNRHCTTTQVWQASDPTHSSWNGCVMDRDQSYDVQNSLATAGATATLFPAAPSTMASKTDWSLTCPSKLIGETDVLDSTGWTNLNNTVNNMQAGGATNQAIGLAWGWTLMTDGSPIINPGALPVNTKQVIILLSDGLNTQDRWYGNGYDHSTDVDGRMAAVCSNAKAAGVTIYTVFVDLNGTQGNSSVLQACASDSSKYFDLTTSNQIITAFNQISHQITKMHVVQ